MLLVSPHMALFMSGEVSDLPRTRLRKKAINKGSEFIMKVGPSGRKLVCSRRVTMVAALLATATTVATANTSDAQPIYARSAGLSTQESSVARHSVTSSGTCATQSDAGQVKTYCTHVTLKASKDPIQQPTAAARQAALATDASLTCLERAGQ